MKVRLRYFAYFRDLTKKSDEVIDERVSSVSEVYEHLRLKYDFPSDPKHLRVAVNGAFSSMTSSLAENDEVVFVPPVSGG